MEIHDTNKQNQSYFQSNIHACTYALTQMPYFY